ncbi:catechol 1,2-dioxygenase [Egicoccus halophilus]|uniref:Dioxygenase n=1 Tax=Egicoccus halophilus TaxID=1670830 RepID=A0A8J3EW12_9ACTN|nr:catechol 1,2-dioxygenase [Egicoccus halophilus]GGI09305.1 dioxygenase [Egicoccus halophilus]
MGEIVGAGLISHAPTIMFDEPTRRELNEGKEISLVPGLVRLRDEVLDALRPDTIVVLDTHWFTTVEHVVSAHDHREGKMTSSELPRGMCQVPYAYDGDPDLARLIEKHGNEHGTPTTAIDDPYLPVYYATVNLVHYLHRGEKFVSVSIVQTGDDDDFLTLGKAIGDAVAASDRRVVVLASGGMSHTFHRLKALPDHEASDPKHIVTPEARAADEERVAWMEAGDHARVIDGMDAYHPHSPEGGFGHYLAMAAAIGGRDCTAPGRRFSDYENATGTGQVHVWFDRPEGGWTA